MGCGCWHMKLTEWKGISLLSYQENYTILPLKQWMNELGLEKKTKREAIDSSRWKQTPNTTVQQAVFKGCRAPIEDHVSLPHPLQRWPRGIMWKEGPHKGNQEPGSESQKKRLPRLQNQASSRVRDFSKLFLKDWRIATEYCPLGSTIFPSMNEGVDGK